jgi:glycosyltransferase involved in cell wall biosynthesis
MRIGLDGLPLTSLKTGVGHYTFELARALASIEPSSHFEIVYPSTYPAIRPGEDGKEFAFPGNLKLSRVQVGPLGRHWWSAGLPRYIRKSKLDIFHGTNYDVPLWRQCATVLTVHDLSLLIHPETHQKGSVRRARRRMPVMARTAEAIITPTESVRREVCEYLKVSSDKIFVVPEAARDCFRPMESHATEAVHRRLGIEHDFLLTVGTIEPRKNLSVLVSAFDEVIRTRLHGNLQLVIAGGAGWLSGPVSNAIEKSSARNRILLTDYLHDDDLRALYSSCRVFIYPSIYEGFGLPPLEAMACGAPVIASRIPTLKETTGDAALLFDHTSAKDLAQKILVLVSDENARQQYSNAGLKRASEFSWDNTAQLTLDVYTKALAKKGNRS